MLGLFAACMLSAVSACGEIPLPASGIIPLEGEYRGHLQDVWYDGKGVIYWAHTQVLLKTDLNGRIIKRKDVEGHHAGIEVKDGKVYVAVCPMQSKTKGKTTPSCRVVIGEFDAETLDLIKYHTTDIVDRAGSLAILEDGTFVVGCLRPQDIEKSQVRFHHLDRDFKLIRSYVHDKVPVRLGIEVIKRKGDSLYLNMYGYPSTVILDRDFKEIGRLSRNGSMGLVFSGDEVWVGRGKRDKVTKLYTSCLVRLKDANAVDIRKPSHTTLIAHRGESHDAPENTLPAYKTAVDRGFGFECDIYRSSDGQLFTFHDRDLKRTTAGANTNACTAVDWEGTLSKVNVGGWGKWKGSQFDPTRPALFSEVLSLARQGRKIYVEVKGGNAAVDWVQDIKKVVDSEPLATPDTILFICFSDVTCAALKKAMPEFQVYWLTGGKNMTADMLIAKLGEIKADGVDIRFDSPLVNVEDVSRIHNAGYSFHVWTIDNPESAKKVFAVGADSLTTNRAKFILDSCEKK